MARKNIDARTTPAERPSAEVRAKVVEAGEFRLVDKAGRVRAALEMTRRGPRLTMMQEDGTISLEMMLSTQGPFVRLGDLDGRTRVFVGATRDAARIGLADGEENPRVFIGVGHQGVPSITLYDPEQHALWEAGK